MFEKLKRNIPLDKILGTIYFFFNTVGLPVPVSYTTLISVVRFKVIYDRFRKVFLAILLVLIGYAIIHNVQGVVVMDYFKSLCYFIFLLASGFVAYHYLKTGNIRIDSTFRFMSVFSLLLLVVAFFFISSPLSHLFWKDHSFVGDGNFVKRFEGFSYEASHLALTLSPILLYFLWKIINKPQIKSIGYFIAVSFPIALTVSFGFVAAFVIAISATLLMVLVIYRKFKRILIIPVSVVLVGVVVLSLFPNPLANRMEVIFKGDDTSVNGRTTEAFYLGYKCAQQESIWFGIGMGQVKYVGEEVIRPYYSKYDPVGYSKENWPVLGIPNSMAETLAIFGIFGVLLKIGFQIFCFVKLKVYQNYFNLSIFFFIFFYQMMGSFILSSTEIIMWAMAFAKIFDEFDIHKELQVEG